MILSVVPAVQYVVDLQGYRNSDYLRTFLLMTIKQEKMNLIETFLLPIEEILSDGTSDDYGRYAQMGLRLDPNHAYFLQRNKETKLVANIIHLLSYNYKLYIELYQTSTDEDGHPRSSSVEAWTVRYRLYHIVNMFHSL